MKIRIKDNSVRFRLTKTEVHKLCSHKQLESFTEFNTTTMVYAIQVRKDINELQADFSSNKIIMHFPEVESETWEKSDRITYKNTMQLNNGNQLQLILEKDFVCLDHTDEDQSDNYENPNKTC